MPLTPQQGMDKLMKRVQRLVGVPSEVIGVVHRELMGDIPVYTGTYREGIGLEFTSNSAAIALTEGALLASARAHASEIQSAVGLTPEEYVEDDYPIRIEEAGRPTDASPSGAHAWSDARNLARETLMKRMRAIAKGRS